MNESSGPRQITIAAYCPRCGGALSTVSDHLVLTQKHTMECVHDCGMYSRVTVDVTSGDVVEVQSADFNDMMTRVTMRNIADDFRDLQRQESR